MFAWAPLCGWAVTCSAPGKRARARGDVAGRGAGEGARGPPRAQPLGDVHVLATAVVAPAGQTLGVLVREPGALRFHDRGKDVVLAGDQLDLAVLADALGDHRRPQIRIDLGDGGPPEPESALRRHAHRPSLSSPTPAPARPPRPQ